MKTKKSLFILGLALIFPLVACNSKNAKLPEKETTPTQEADEGNTDPVEEEDDYDPGEAKREQASDLIYTFILDNFGLDAADESKATIEDYCANPIFAELNISKINTYLTLYELIDTENPEEIMGFLNALAHDDVLEDAVYFAVAVVKVSLHAAGYNNSEQKETYDNYIAVIDNENGAIEENLILVIEKLSDAYISFMTEMILSGASIIDADTGKVDFVALMKLMRNMKPALKEILEIKSSVAYFADLAVRVGSEYFLVDEEIPFEIDELLEFIQIDLVVNGVFDLLEVLVDALPTLSDEYFDTLESIEDPTEAYIYGFVGIIYEAAHIESFTHEELKDTVHASIYAMSLVAALSNGLIELPDFVELLLENEQIEALVVNVILAVYDLFGLEPESDDAMELIAKLAEILGEITSEVTNDVYQSLEELPEEIAALLPLEDINQAIENLDYETFEDDIHVITEIAYNEVLDTYSYVMTEVDYYVEVYGDLVVVYVETAIEEFEVPSLQPIVNYLYEGLDYLATNLDAVDGAVDKIVDFVNSACEFVASLEEDIPEEYYAYAEDAMELIALYMTDENIELVKKAAEDLVVALRDFVTAFIPDEEGNVDIDFTELMIKVANGQFVIDDYFNTIQSAKLISFREVFVDVYLIAEAIDQKEALLAYLDEASGMELSILADTADNFGGMMFLGLIGYFGR